MNLTTLTQVAAYKPSTVDPDSAFTIIRVKRKGTTSGYFSRSCADSKHSPKSMGKEKKSRRKKKNKKLIIKYMNRMYKKNK
jgi:hypothetical protein